MNRVGNGFSWAWHAWPFLGGLTAFTPTVPKLFWQVESQEERLLRLSQAICALKGISDDLAQAIENLGETTGDALADLKEYIDGLIGSYEELCQKWVDENLERVIDDHIHSVFFGLTLDGYFVAYIPDSWEDITFDTGAVYGETEYGRLMLYYDVDSPHWVQQP